MTQLIGVRTLNGDILWINPDYIVYIGRGRDFHTISLDIEHCDGYTMDISVDEKMADFVIQQVGGVLHGEP